MSNKTKETKEVCLLSRVLLYQENPSRPLFLGGLYVKYLKKITSFAINIAEVLIHYCTTPAYMSNTTENSNFEAL